MDAPPYETIRDLEDAEVDATMAVQPRLKRAWSRSRAAVLSDDAREKLHRRWGIELGLVEDIFRWDRGVTMTLIDEGLSAELLSERTGVELPKAENDLKILQAHLDVLREIEMGFVKQESRLTAKLIRELHEKLVGPQAEYTVVVPGSGAQKRPLPAGKFKEHPNNPSRGNGVIKNYCPPNQTESEVIRLCDLYHAPSVQSASPEVRAAWLHHRFTQIHPFADGNGRVARALATIEFLREGLLPLIIRRDEDRSAYLDALEAADDGQLAHLSRLFIARQNSEISSLLRSAPGTTDAAAALREANTALMGRLELRLERARNLFHQLHAAAGNGLNRLSSDITRVLAASAPGGVRYEIEKPTIIVPNDEKAHDFDDWIVAADVEYPRQTEIAGYFHAGIRTDDRFRFLLHLHERAAEAGPAFAFLALAATESLEGDGDPVVFVLPIDPLFIPVDEAATAAGQQKVQRWGTDAINTAVSFWGKST